MSSPWTAARVADTSPDGAMVLNVSPMPDSTPPAVGTDVLVQVRQSRSVRQHRWYWAMLRSVVEATDQWRSEEELHTWCRYRLGLFRPVEVEGERVVLEWVSTSWPAMSQERFAWFVEQATVEIAMETGIDVDALMEGRDERAEQGTRVAREV